MIARGARIFSFFLAAAVCSGCAFGSAPLENTPHVAATPVAGQLSVAVTPQAPVGGVLPVYVSIANGADTPCSIVPNQVFAIDKAGERIAPIPPAEAARQAGGAGELRDALESGAASGIAGGVLGAGVGALAGAFVHSGATGAAIGGAIGAGEGALQGAPAGQGRADQQASIQMTALSLPAQDVRRGFSVGGYVYFPKGDYESIQMLLVEQESGDTEVVNRPLR
jgi:hypothetical protein